MTLSGIMHVSANYWDSLRQAWSCTHYRIHQTTNCAGIGMRVMYSHSSTVVGDIVAFTWNEEPVVYLQISYHHQCWTSKVPFANTPFVSSSLCHSFGLAQSPCLAPSSLHQDISFRAQNLPTSSEQGREILLIQQSSTPCIQFMRALPLYL